MTDIANLATNTTSNAKIRLKVKFLLLLIQLQLLTLLLLNIKYPMLVIQSKISEMENKYFTISDYNKFTSNTLHAKIEQKV